MVRYQRKASPSEEHDRFRELNKEAQQKVWHLSALLRLAIALNKERRGRVTTTHIEVGDDHFTLHLHGDGDLNLERWAALNTGNYLEQAFGRTLHIDLQLP